MVCATIGNFIDNEMDGEAVEVAVAATPGPDCLKDIIPKVGLRLKVYNRIKTLIQNEVIEVWNDNFVIKYTHMLTC